MIVLVVAVGLRLYSLGAAPLWTDELFSLQSTAGRGFWVEELPQAVVMNPATRPTDLLGAAGVADIYWGQSTDTHPPLYFMLLRLVREVFGSSAEALRAISVVASVATVAAMYVAGLFMDSARGRRVAIVAAVLTTVATSQIIFAQEARGYALATALVTVCAATVLRVQQQGWTTQRAAILGTSATLALGTLYLAAIPLLAIGLYMLLELKGTRRVSLIVLGTTAVLSLACWGPLLYVQRGNVGLRNQWLISETPRSIASVATDAAVAVFSQVAQLQDRSLPAALVAAGVLVLGAVPLYRRVPASRLWLLWLGAMVATLMAMDLLGNKTHLKLSRYTLLTGPPLFGVLASLLTIRWGKPVIWLSVPVAVALLSVLSLGETYRTTKEDWNIVRNYVRNGTAKPTDLFLVAATGTVKWENLLYLGLCRNVEYREFAAVIVTKSDADLSEVRADIARRQGVTMLLDFGTDMSAALPPGYTRTGLMNFPSVGILTTFRPNTAAITEPPTTAPEPVNPK